MSELRNSTHAPAAAKRRGGPRHGYRKHRRVLRVERFPEALRALVDRGLAQGKSFRQIQEELAAAGEKVSGKALRNYWRYPWQQQHRRLQWVNAQAEALAQLLRHTGESDEALLARKLLLAQVLERLEDVKRIDIFDLLRETREMVKATRHLQPKSAAARRPLSRAEMRRRVREIYGWPEEQLSGEAPNASGKTAP